jgi:hypothetical protein
MLLEALVAMVVATLALIPLLTSCIEGSRTAASATDHAAAEWRALEILDGALASGMLFGENAPGVLPMAAIAPATGASWAQGAFCAAPGFTESCRVVRVHEDLVEVIAQVRWSTRRELTLTRLVARPELGTMQQTPIQAGAEAAGSTAD